ncbi:MAG: TIGR03862 family flavoprotein [Flavobacteriales bacterium]|nr:TIGR03862 family flavoprotein [Flavobacteriales bacterium]
MDRKRIAIIGGGPAGLMAADVIAPHHDVVLYEQGRTLGRKFLVAGKGGFNLTNSASGADLKQRYDPPGFLDRALDAFGPEELREWLSVRGIATYVGSSGRVFPLRGIKPIAVLNAIRARLDTAGVRSAYGHRLVAFDARAMPVFEVQGVRKVIEADAVILALGGASWSVTGSSGNWVDALHAVGIDTAPFAPSNCGMHASWPASLIDAHAGKPLKNIRASVGERSVLGEATITRHGLEGNAIYPLVPMIHSGPLPGTLHLDLRPNNSFGQLLGKLSGRAPKAFADALHLDRVQLALLKALTPRSVSLSAEAFCTAVKELSVPITGLRPLEEAISTVGGIRPEDLNDDLSLKRFPLMYTIGEMVDWDAPTGGFLLQGCFSMGHLAGHAVLRRFAGEAQGPTHM